MRRRCVSLFKHMNSYAPVAADAIWENSKPRRNLICAEVSEALKSSSPEERRTHGPESRLDQIEAIGQRCREGEWAAWDSLFSAAWPGLVTFVHRLYSSFDKEDAEDVAQASLEAAIKGIQTFSGEGLFRGWLFGIAANQAAMFYRNRSAKKRGTELLVPLNSSSEQGDDSKSPAQLSAENDRAGILHRAIEQLEERDRDLIHLHFFGELTFKQIAELRKMNAKTVCTRVRRSQEKLLGMLARLNLTNANG